MAMRRPDLSCQWTTPCPSQLHPFPYPVPYPGATATRPPSSPDGTVPPVPSEVTKERTRTQGPAAAGRFRAVMMMPLRKMMRRTPSPP